MRTHVSTRVASIVLLVCAGAAAAESVETELKFATGLRELHYYNLAAHQFKTLDWSQQKDPKIRLQIAEGLIETWLAAAGTASSPTEALRYVVLADGELARFLKTQLAVEQRNRLAMKRGNTLIERGRRAREVYRRKPAGVDVATVAAEGENAFDAAAGVYSQVVASCKEIVKKVEAKVDVNDADRKLRRDTLNQQIVAETQIGWASFRRARLYRDRNMQQAFQKELAAAAGIFKKQSAAHKRIMAGLSATLGWALCLQELNKHKEAIAAFDEVLEVRPSRDVDPIRYQAQYEKAVSQMALGDFEGSRRTLSLERKVPSALKEAWQLRYAHTYGKQADGIRAREQKLLKQAQAFMAKKTTNAYTKARRLKAEAKKLRKTYRKLYELAIGEARKLTGTETYYAQEAGLLLGEWIAAGELSHLRSATDFFADGEYLCEQNKYAEAVVAYREAIRRARRTKAHRQLAHDAWIQMGKAYAQSGRHYEAGLVLGRVARLYPDSPYAEKSAVYSAMLLGHQYQQGRTPLEAQMYLEAQDLLVDHYPHTDAARRAAFRLGDVRRAQKQYERAAHYYKAVDRASTFYEQAGYLTGECLWKASLEKEGSGKDAAAAGRLFQRAESHLRTFLKWAAEQPGGTPETVANRRLWTAKSRLLFAGMYFHRKQYRDVLDILNDKSLATFKQAPPTDENLLANARLLRIRAYCALNRVSDTRKAGRQMRALEKDERVPGSLKSTAARYVGLTFLKHAEDLGKKKHLKPGAPDPEVRGLLDNARTYLNLSIKLNPKQTVDEYQQIAKALHQTGAYTEAANTFELLVERFGKAPKHRELILDARRWIGVCYKEAGQWAKAAAAFEGLVKQEPRWMNVREDLALCYESDVLERYKDAEKQWRTIEANSKMGKAQWHKARFHRVRTLACQGRGGLAFQMLAATLVAHPNLGGDPWEQQYIDLVAQKFSKEQQEAFRKLQQETLEPETQSKESAIQTVALICRQTLRRSRATDLRGCRSASPCACRLAASGRQPLSESLSKE